MAKQKNSETVIHSKNDIFKEQQFLLQFLGEDKYAQISKLKNFDTFLMIASVPISLCTNRMIFYNDILSKETDPIFIKVINFYINYRHVRIGNYEETLLAKNYFEEISQNTQNSAIERAQAQAYANYAIVKTDNSKTSDEIIQLFNQSLQNPDFIMLKPRSELILALSNKYIDIKRYDKAALECFALYDLYENLISFDILFDIVYNIVIIHHYNEKLQDSINFIINFRNKYKDLFTEGQNSKIEYTIGSSYFRLNDYNKAINHLKNSSNFAAKYFLGLSNYSLKNIKVAEQYFNEYLQTNETFYKNKAYFFLAKIKFATKEYEVAINYIKETLKTDMQTIEKESHLSLLARSLYILGDHIGFFNTYNQISKAASYEIDFYLDLNITFLLAAYSSPQLLENQDEKKQEALNIINQNIILMRDKDINLTYCYNFIISALKHDQENCNIFAKKISSNHNYIDLIKIIFNKECNSAFNTICSYLIASLVEIEEINDAFNFLELVQDNFPDFKMNEFAYKKLELSIIESKHLTPEKKFFLYTEVFKLCRKLKYSISDISQEIFKLSIELVPLDINKYSSIAESFCDQNHKQQYIESMGDAYFNKAIKDTNLSNRKKLEFLCNSINFYDQLELKEKVNESKRLLHTNLCKLINKTQLISDLLDYNQLINNYLSANKELLQLINEKCFILLKKVNIQDRKQHLDKIEAFFIEFKDDINVLNHKFFAETYLNFCKTEKDISKKIDFASKAIFSSNIALENKNYTANIIIYLNELNTVFNKLLENKQLTSEQLVKSVKEVYKIGTLTNNQDRAVSIIEKNITKLFPGINYTNRSQINIIKALIHDKFSDNKDKVETCILMLPNDESNVINLLIFNEYFSEPSQRIINKYINEIEKITKKQPFSIRCAVPPRKISLRQANSHSKAHSTQTFEFQEDQNNNTENATAQEYTEQNTASMDNANVQTLTNHAYHQQPTQRRTFMFNPYSWHTSKKFIEIEQNRRADITDANLER